MGDDDSKYLSATLRLVVQLAAVALVVAVPWFLSQRLIANALVAQDWVTHTVETKNLVNEIHSSVGDFDRAVLRLALFPEEAPFRDQLAEERLRLSVQLDELSRLVVDNEDQRARVAQAHALSQARMAEAARVQELLDAGELDDARILLASPAVTNQLADVTRAIVVAEDALLAERREMSSHQRLRAAQATTAIAIVQLILLSLIVGVSERLHRRRRALEAQTRDAQQRSDLILNAVRKPIALLDRDLRVLLCNPAFGALYANDGNNPVGRPLQDVGEGVWADAVLLQKLRDVCFLGRELWDHEVEQVRGASGYRVMLVNARRMPGTTAANATLILTANDVTAARGAEHDIRELNEQLSTRVREISEANHELEGFSYSVSHDLRAPLRHIAAFTGKLERELDLGDNANAAHYLRVVIESSRRMGLLIDELLVHTKLGRSQIRSMPVAMGPLVDEVRAILAPEVGARSVEWRIDPLPTVSGDASMLRLVWQNLIGNAVKYTVQRDPAVITISASLDQTAGEAVFKVEDNGAGFDMAYVDKLFGVFQRLHTSDEFPGTGIGLANVRRIVGRHGGRVWAEGETGVGARFFFSLPLPAPTTGVMTK